MDQLELRVSGRAGSQVWRESGLGAPIDIEALQQQIATLEQSTLTLRDDLAERVDELAAARAILCQ